MAWMSSPVKLLPCSKPSAAMLLEDVPRELEQLREFLAWRDGKTTILVAHGRKGELGSLGMKRAHSTA